MVAYSELQKLPSKLYSPLFEDRNPDPEKLIGKRIAWFPNGKQLFGHVLRVYNKHVLISLEKKWMKRTRWTVNWTNLYFAPNVDADVQQKEEQSRKENELLRIKGIQDHMEKIAKFYKEHETQKYPYENSQSKYAQKYIEERNNYQNCLEELNILKNTLLQIHNALTVLHEECIKKGIEPENIPELPVISDGVFFEKKTVEKKKLKEKKKELMSIRSTTRFMLINILIASGEEGLNSEDIIKTIIHTAKNTNQKEYEIITSHRIMGMLSALSRRKEAESIDGKKWKATEFLRENQETFFTYET